MELIQTSQIEGVQPDVLLYFINGCQELSKLISSQGYTSTACNEIGLAKFKTLPEPQQHSIVQALESYVHQIKSALQEKVDITGDNSKHAWWAMSKMGLRASDGTFENIKSTDIIEIYNLDSIQVFRSFEMFKYLSYSLSEIFSHGWVELYNRDEFVFRRIFNFVSDILSGKSNEAINPNFPPHVVSEKFSEQKYWAKMEHKLVAPLYTREGKVGGLITTFSILEHGTLDN